MVTCRHAALFFVMLATPQLSRLAQSQHEKEEANIFQDGLGHLHVQAGHGRDVYISTSDNDQHGSVYVNGINLSEQLQQLKYMWQYFPIKPRLLAMGGVKTVGSHSLVESFDGNPNSRWHQDYQSHPMHIGMQYFGVAAVGTSLYAMSGASSQVFDGQQWQSIPSMPTPRQALTAAHYNGEVFAIGGLFNGTASSVVEVLQGVSSGNISDLSWTPAPTMPTARSFLTSAVFQGRLYVLGGYDITNNILNTVESFDGNEWRSEPAMLRPRDSLGAAVLGGKLYVIGGVNRGALYTVEVFDGTSWRYGPENIPTPRDLYAVAKFQGKIYAAGGSTVSGLTGVVEAFDGESWSSVAPLQIPRKGLMLAAYPEEVE